ncbi:hypothetical protein GQ53DRAFT_751075 [Thozetella sp. PMI_491]|nr:hypothetical protein GQ53DRAFT_751075 [Thozetella sp. PMI_491]
MATPFSDTETAVDKAFDPPPPQTLQQDNTPANPYPYTSFEEAYKALAIQSQQLGFSILKKRSNNHHPATGEYRRHDFYCSQGKKAPSKVTVRKRRVASIKRDCPWKAKVEIFVPTYNHDLEEDA